MDIKALRQRLNLTQEQLARRLGVSWATVSRWERGIGEPSPLAQKAIEGLLKASKIKQAAHLAGSPLPQENQAIGGGD